MAHGQHTADRRIEWAILVLGLAGIVAIFVPFAYGLSPLNALPVLMEVGSWVTARSRAFEIYVDIAATTAVLAFFLAPLLSYAQLSRCLGRPLSRWERKLLLASALVVTVGSVVGPQVATTVWRLRCRAPGHGGVHRWRCDVGITLFAISPANGGRGGIHLRRLRGEPAAAERTLEVSLRGGSVAGGRSGRGRIRRSEHDAFAA